MWRALTRPVYVHERACTPDPADLTLTTGNAAPDQLCFAVRVDRA